jgi:hypothetical protein
MTLTTAKLHERATRPAHEILPLEELQRLQSAGVALNETGIERLRAAEENREQRESDLAGQRKDTEAAFHAALDEYEAATSAFLDILPRATAAAEALAAARVRTKSAARAARAVGIVPVQPKSLALRASRDRNLDLLLQAYRASGSLDL